MLKANSVLIPVLLLAGLVGRAEGAGYGELCRKFSDCDDRWRFFLFRPRNFLRCWENCFLLIILCFSWPRPPDWLLGPCQCAILRISHGGWYLQAQRTQQPVRHACRPGQLQTQTRGLRAMQRSLRLRSEWVLRSWLEQADSKLEPDEAREHGLRIDCNSKKNGWGMDFILRCSFYESVSRLVPRTCLMRPQHWYHMKQDSWGMVLMASRTDITRRWYHSFWNTCCISVPRSKWRPMRTWRSDLTAAATMFPHQPACKSLTSIIP